MTLRDAGGEASTTSAYVPAGPGVVEVLDAERYSLPLPAVGVLAEAILLCIVCNGSVSPTEVGCRTDMPRFLVAANGLAIAGWPIASKPGRHVRWAWSWRTEFDWLADTDCSHPLLIDGKRMLRVRPLLAWAAARSTGAARA